MPTLESLQAKIQKLQAQAEALVAKKSSAVIEKIRGLMAEHGLTTADVDAHGGGKKSGPKPRAMTSNAKARSAVEAKGKLPSKYINPKTGETWSGHARPPAWIANVKDRSKFLIADGNEVIAAATKGTAGKAKTTANRAPKAASATKAVGNYLRGPQPVLYRDPEGGATWTGRGRAPAWIANAKDRSMFLIDGVTAADKKSVVEKKAPTAKKTVAKNAASRKSSANKAPAKQAPAKSAGVAAPAAPRQAAAELTA
ncbi:H-NS family nucleoid-associated regulatory protein [Paraburkholderia sartisoli]|uniref:DNA-binding protein H-NS n=1 Tax=Paraburkholderia sartisoli TaxID=83784 RepID=A0A1H4GQW9_9BURK|nr:H-NS family nucleoid-associated regulatory protein [Paraburkholderia sartisoli]SEB11934.1 DNA-binding protein H-NS [Paraburkholderia sartisoli]